MGDRSLKIGDCVRFREGFAGNYWKPTYSGTLVITNASINVNTSTGLPWFEVTPKGGGSPIRWYEPSAFTPAFESIAMDILEGLDEEGIPVQE